MTDLRRFLLNLCCSFCSLWALMLLSEQDVREPFSLVLFVLLFLFMDRFGFGKEKRRFHAASACCAAVMTLLLVLGNCQRLTARFDNPLFRGAVLLIQAIGLMLLLTVFCRFAMERLLPQAQSAGRTSGSGTGRPSVSRVFSSGVLSFIKRHLFAFSLIVLILVWLPNYLYEYPGIFSPDSIVQMEQVLELRALSNHHPAAHTLLMKLFVCTGMLLGQYLKVRDPLCFGAGLYCLIQLIFHAFSCALVIKLLQKLRLPAFFPTGALLFFAFVPYHAVFGIYAGKDTPFTDIYLLLTISLIHLILPKTGCGRKTDLIHFVLAGTAFCIFRGNGWYAFLILLPFLLILLRNQLKTLLPAGFLILILSLGIKGPLYSAAGIASADFVESLHVPLQQIARVVCDNKPLTEEETALIEKTVNHIEDIPVIYDPAFADMTKELIRTNGNQAYLEAHKGEYLRLWIRLGLKYPDSYLAAWVDLTRAYWYPDTDYEVALIEGVADNSFGLYSRPLIGGKLIVKLREILLKLGSFIPLYGLLFSMGMCFFLLLFLAALILGSAHFRRRLLILLPGFALYLTLFLAAPVAEFRYAYPMMSALPLFLAAPFIREEI